MSTEKQMLEKEIEAKVVAYAKERGLLVYKFTSPNHIGVPDRMLLGPWNHTFFIEFKREGGKLTPMQDREAQRLGMFGFPVYLVTSVEEGKGIIEQELQVCKSKVFVQTLAERFDRESGEAEPSPVRH